LILEI